MQHVQLSETNYVTHGGCLFWGNIYNDTRKVMGVVPAHALLVGYFTFRVERLCRLYILNLKLVNEGI